MAGGIDWFRWHHGTVTDQKFPLVARRAGATVAEVLAVWACLLERASMSELERGWLGDTVDFEAMDCALGLADGQALAIFNALQQRGLVTESRQVAAWHKRQPKRERQDDTSTERGRKHRASKHQAEPDGADETPCNATQHQKTPRGEESREEEINTSSLRSDKQTSAAPKGSRAPKAQKPVLDEGEEEAFNAAWADYPSRPGNSKVDARKAWASRRADGVSAERMADGVRRYAAYCAAQRVEPKFIKHADTFLGSGLHFDSDWTPTAPHAGHGPPRSFQERNAEAAKAQYARISGQAQATARSVIDITPREVLELRNA